MSEGSAPVFGISKNVKLVGRTDISGGGQVVVENGYWSAGGVFTRTHTGRNIRKLKKATLVANIPNGAEFDFALGSAHNAERCTWHASGAGKSRYEFDLDGLNHCDCRNNGFMPLNLFSWSTQTSCCRSSNEKRAYGS
jgi:hypothetical protein